MSEITKNASKSVGTRVDLGEDLLEKTMIVGPPSQTRSVDSVLNAFNIAAVTRENMTDVLQSVRILMSERLFEDSKKLLHQILIVDAENSLAKKYLAEVHAEELKLLFGGPTSSRPRQGSQAMLSDVDPELLMRKLDQDLGLGIFSSDSFSPGLEQMSLFQNPEEVDQLCKQLEKNLALGSPQDWIDMGIGFLEMDLFSIAIRLFTGACRQLNTSSGKDTQAAISATSLLALTLIQAGRPYEAVTRVQPLLLDVDIAPEDKVELFYLMGRVYEMMNKPELAVKFYNQVKEINSDYRDVQERPIGKKKEGFC